MQRHLDDTTLDDYLARSLDSHELWTYDLLGGDLVGA